MFLEDFQERKNLLFELTKISEFEDDILVLVVIKDKRMPLAEYIRCPSLPVLWRYIRRLSNGKFDKDNVIVYYKDKPKYRLVFPLRGRNGQKKINTCRT